MGVLQALEGVNVLEELTVLKLVKVVSILLVNERVCSLHQQLADVVVE